MAADTPPVPTAPAHPGSRVRSLFVRWAGRGAPLLLLHGLASSSRYWEPYIAVLSGAYRVIAPDLLGFGRSPKPLAGAYTPEEHLTALLTTVERHLDAPMTVVGHSMGAILALHLAVERPAMVERMVLISLPALGGRAWGHGPDGRCRPLHHFAVHTAPGRLLCSAGQHALRPLAAVLYPPLRRDIPRGAAEDSLQTGWTAYWRSLEAVVYGSRVEQLFAAVRGPLTLIHGARDFVAPASPVRRLARTRPDVRYIELANAAHNPCHTHWRAFLAALDERLLPPPLPLHSPLPGHPLRTAPLARRAMDPRQ